MPDVITCWACDRTGRSEPLTPGWSMRADGFVVSCPDHKQFMPPHPKANPVDDTRSED